MSCARQLFRQFFMRKRPYFWHLSEDFVSWIPNNIKSNVVNTPPDGVDLSGTFISNTTSIKAVFFSSNKAFKS